MVTNIDAEHASETLSTFLQATNMLITMATKDICAKQEGYLRLVAARAMLDKNIKSFEKLAKTPKILKKLQTDTNKIVDGVMKQSLMVVKEKIKLNGGKQ